MSKRRNRTLRLVILLCTVSVLLSFSLQACGLLPASATARPAASDGVTVTLTWDEWKDLSNCVRFVTDDIGLTLDVAQSQLDTNTQAEANATVNRLTQLGAKLDRAAEESAAAMSAAELQAALDAQLGRTRQFVDLQSRLFEARMDALVSP